MVPILPYPFHAVEFAVPFFAAQLLQDGTASSVPQPFWPAGESEPADASDDGLERFLTATRRQNFLIPPRRHRSFPLLEFT